MSARDFGQLPVVRIPLRNRKNPARCQGAERGRARAFFDHRPLSHDRSGAYLRDRLAIDLHLKSAIEHEEHLVTRLTLLDQRVPLVDRASFLFGAADDDRGQLALQSAFHRLHHRRGVVGAPWGALAERLIDPCREIGQPRLHDELAGVVVDPVAREAAGTDQLAPDAAVGVDRQGEGGPRDRRIDLEEGLATDRPRRRHPGAATACLSEPHGRVRHDRLVTNVGHRLRLHGHGLRAELEARHTDATTAVLSPSRYLSVLDLDPGLELVALAEEVLAVPLVQVVESRRQGFVVVSQAHRERHGQKALYRFIGDPRNRCNGALDFHVLNLRPATYVPGDIRSMVSAGLFGWGLPHGCRDAGSIGRIHIAASNTWMGRMKVLLADDSVIVREGLRALLLMAADIEVVGAVQDFDELVARAGEVAPDVIVTDIRMPPTFQSEGIDAALLVRKRHPGTGIVILSQFDDPEYALALLSQGASGLAYLLKDRVAEGDQLARAIRTVSGGGSMLDPKVVEALVRPINDAELSPADEELLGMVAEGRTINAIAARRKTTGADVAASVEQLFLALAKQATGGREAGVRNLRRLHQAIVDREEQGEVLSRLLPGGVADRLRRGGRGFGQTERLVVTVLISDVRGYSAIAEDSDPGRLAVQLKEHRAVASDAVLAERGTIMQFVGDSVMAVFGAPEPQPHHAERALRAALAMHMAQYVLNQQWKRESLPSFALGVGLSTGLVAAALIGGRERAEYSLVGDTVNLAQRLQQFASSGETVLSEPTYSALVRSPHAERIGPMQVKGRKEKITAYRVPAPLPGK